jgi:hypothetical protein
MLFILREAGNSYVQSMDKFGPCIYFVTQTQRVTARYELDLCMW